MPKNKQVITGSDSCSDSQFPQHVAIVMDGNGRWAKSRVLPRIMGHRKGVEVVRNVVQWCAEYNIPYLSLFAFSTENWRRPDTEISQLMTLFMLSLKNEAQQLHKKGVRLRVIGNRNRLPLELQEEIKLVEKKTCNNDKLTLIICANYGGHWDIFNAVQQCLKTLQNDGKRAEDLTREMFAEHLQISDLPNPDIFIRTSGEKRISNFYLWQLAYTELYFCDCHWPDFSHQDFIHAIESYTKRVRRFGKI